MNEYQTILSPRIGLVFVLALNVIVVILAFLLSSRIQSLRWLPHILALAAVVASPLMLLVLTAPEIQVGEESGPGDGLILLPLLLECAVIFGLYAMVCIWLVISRFFKYPVRTGTKI
jgi:hypothetical protein